jgi:hypothetical protein
MILNSFQLFQSFQLFPAVRPEVGTVGRKERKGRKKGFGLVGATLCGCPSGFDIDAK